MKAIILLLFGIGALWDVATTVYGTWIIFPGRTALTLIASVVFGLVILALLASTLWIWRKGGVSGIVFKIAWLVGLGYDLWTSWSGNYDLLFAREPTGAQVALAIGLTCFMSLSPMAFVTVQEEID
jgi:hypothetical protein